MLDIDPITLVISLVLFAAFCAPFVYHIRKQRKTTRQQHARLLQDKIQINCGCGIHWRGHLASPLCSTSRGKPELCHIFYLNI